MNYYNEIDKRKAAWLRELIKRNVISKGIVDERSIVDVQPGDLDGYRQCHWFAGIGVWSYSLRLAGVSDDEPVWTGSCPCTPFSQAGRKKGKEDERHLWPSLFRLIDARRPQRFFGEQVSNKDGLAWLDDVRLDLDKAGYESGSVDLCAAGLGAPHVRQRLYFMAIANDSDRRPGISGAQAATREDRIRWERLTGSGTTGGRSLANHDTQGRTVCGTPQHVLDGDPPWDITDGCSEALSMAYAHPEGLEGRGRPERFGDTQGRTDEERRSTAGGAVNGSLANTAEYNRRSVQDEAEERRRGGPVSRQSSDECGAVNGFWRDAEWVWCRDGKYRPTGAILVQVADGSSGDLRHLCSSGSFTEEREEVDDTSQSPASSAMSSVRSGDDEEAFPLSAGRCSSVPEEKILQPQLHGAAHGADEGGERAKQSPAIGKDSETSVRVVQPFGYEAARSPQGPQFAEQRSRELANFVRLLPSSVALAELHGNTATEKFLRSMLPSRCQAELVQYTPDEAEEAWRSAPEKVQNRLRMAVAKGELVIGPLPPLARKSPARVLRLRGYGDAIVAPVAAEFIRAAMSYPPAEGPADSS